MATSIDRPPRRFDAMFGTAVVLAAAMCAVSAGSFALRPSATPTRQGTAVSLEQVVPKSFSDWRALPEQLSMVVNPQAEQYLYGLYSQVLSRTYVDSRGYRVMLSIAYNEDQRGGLQTHRPEACYPAQGFRVSPTETTRVSTAFGDIEAQRLNASLGARKEPITYWVTVGSQVVNNRFDKRLAEMKLALTGQVPDGMLFRISSIDEDAKRAYAAHIRFAADMMGAVPVSVRKQLSGLSSQQPPG